MNHHARTVALLLGTWALVFLTMLLVAAYALGEEPPPPPADPDLLCRVYDHYQGTTCCWHWNDECQET